MHINDLLAHHRTVIHASVGVVSGVHRDDLDRHTPCAEWTLADLLAHMTAQHHGFAAAARGRGADRTVWQAQPVGRNPVAEYTAAAEGVLAAFAEPGLPDRELHLPELRPSPFPASRAVAFHLVDYLVHGWDVARALGLDFRPDPEPAEPALRIALSVPNDDSRWAPGAPFGPALPADADADPLHRTLAALGRRPDWSPPRRDC